MIGWLSSSWEANWRSFQYFNLYRLIVAALLTAANYLSSGLFGGFWGRHTPLFDWVGLLYLLFLCCGAILSVRWQHAFNRQLSVQVLADVLAATLLMYASGGATSGLGVLLLVSLAAASLVGRGHLVLFYSAVATLSVLYMQIYGVIGGEFDATSIVQAGFLSAGFFATAILARLLGQRIMANEELARQRGIALQDQAQISRRIIERVQDGVLVVMPDGRVQGHNPAVESLLGTVGPDGLRLADYSLSLAQAFVAWMGKGGSDTLDFDVAGRELRARFESTASSQGESLIFIEDISRLKERAQQLKLASLGRLTASIAHEIRNPLAAISHAGDLLREERRIDIQDRLLRILHDNVARLDRIVRDVLDLGRSDRAQLESLDLAEFVGQFVETYCSAEGMAVERLALDIPASSPCCFDRAHLHQVLWNLLTNALRHCQGQVGSVRVQVRPGREGGRVELHVMDDGPGIPEGIREQIFEPFFTTEHQGTGLGLFIARELCEANGASLEVLPSDQGGHFLLVGRSDTCQ